MAINHRVTGTVIDEGSKDKTVKNRNWVDEAVR